MVYKETANAGPQSSMIAAKIHWLNDENPTISARDLVNKVKEYLSNLNLNGWFNVSTFDSMDENCYSVIVYCADTDEVISFTITD